MSKILLATSLFWFNFAGAQPAATIKLADLEKIMSDKATPVHIINFWATWCGPCIKELPFFEKITAKGSPDIKVTLVSMDLDLDPDPEKVYKFIARKNLQSEVFLLDEPDPNSWINSIEKEWSGALPATIIINHRTGERKFIGRALREGELDGYLQELQ